MTDSSETPSAEGSQETEQAREHGDPPGEPPTVTCSRCDRTWELSYELDELQVGNRALERFALDHHRHTGHYPDDVTPWLSSCRRCPEEEPFLSERPARRFAETHARHTGHTVELTAPDDGDGRLITHPDPDES